MHIIYVLYVKIAIYLIINVRACMGQLYASSLMSLTFLFDLLVNFSVGWKN